MKINKKILLCTLFILCIVTTSVFAESKEYKVKEKVNELGNKFDFEKAYCLVDNYIVEYKEFNRNDEVIIQDEDDTYYYVNDNNLIVAIEKKYIRTEKEEAFESFEGYTTSGARAYSDFDLNEEINRFSLNDKVEVIDEVDDIYLIMLDGKIAYMNVNSISKTEIKVYVAPKVETPVYESSSSSSSGSSGGGSSSGGSSDSSSSGGSNEPSSNPEPTPTPSPEPTPAPASPSDGEEIELAYYEEEYETVLLTNNNFINGKVLLDNTKAYIAFLKRNDELKVINKSEDNYEVSFGGYITKIPTKYLRLVKEKAPEVKEYYAKWGTTVYSDYELEKSITTLSVNTTLKIVDEIDDYYVIELEDGTFGYIEKDQASETKIVIKQYVAPKEETPVYSESSSSSSSSSSSGSSSSSNSNESSSSPEPSTPPATPEPTPSSDESQEWTEPTM